MRWPDGRSISVPRPDRLSEVEAEMDLFAARLPGVLVERKPFSAALHFRMAPELKSSVLSWLCNWRRRPASTASRQHGVRIEGAMGRQRRRADLPDGRVRHDRSQAHFRWGRHHRRKRIRRRCKSWRLRHPRRRSEKVCCCLPDRKCGQDSGLAGSCGRGVAMTASVDLWPIGNCQVSALVDRAGVFVWGCVPRVDGDPAFSALLDEPRWMARKPSAAGQLTCRIVRRSNKAIEETPQSLSAVILTLLAGRSRSSTSARG